MVVVQAYREVVAQYRILQDRGLEDPFLDLAWQVSPQPECRATEQREIRQQVICHSQGVATEQAVKQAVGARRGEERSIAAELRQALDATELAERPG